MFWGLLKTFPFEDYLFAGLHPYIFFDFWGLLIYRVGMGPIKGFFVDYSYRLTNFILHNIFFTFFLFLVVISSIFVCGGRWWMVVMVGGGSYGVCLVITMSHPNLS